LIICHLILFDFTLTISCDFVFCLRVFSWIIRSAGVCFVGFSSIEQLIHGSNWSTKYAKAKTKSHEIVKGNAMELMTNDKCQTTNVK